jgi:hypothetical protein
LKLRPKFLLKLSAIALGTYIALYLNGWDWDPEAGNSFLAPMTIQVENSYSFKDGIRVVNLSFPDGTSVTIMGDELVPLMKHLIRQDSKKVEIEVREKGLEVLSR